MSGRHLLSISVGPVQDFIAQARRTRDLWYGSHLLSELSRAAAKAVADHGGEMIFPPFDRSDVEFAECDGPIRPTGTPPAAVANRILVATESEDAAEALAKVAREAVECRWQGLAKGVRKRMKRECVLATGIDDIWKEQIDDVVEFYAAWVPFGNDFAQARREVESAVAGRKALRDFAPWRHHRAGAPKSSLDGARVSVLNEIRSGSGFARLRIGGGEQLDAVGLCKRAGGKPDQFVPLPNIAAAAWLAHASETASDELSALRNASKELGVQEIHRTDLPVTEPFPFDASVLYPNRWLTLFEEMGKGAARDADATEWGETHVRPLLKAVRSEPPPYVACLVADGDHMGKALDELAGGDDPVVACRTFSERLLKFPDRAKQIVSEHLGAPVYAGGDDVLAFLPVATALDCAQCLADEFRDVMDGTAVREKPTLSVGIGIAHVVEAMGLLLDRGREAERKAKEAGRNALSIVFDKRSGGRREWSRQWCDAAPPLGRLRTDAGLLDSDLSSGKVYQAAALLRRFPTPSDPQTSPTMAEALVAYAKQVFAQSGDGCMTDEAIMKLGLFPDAAPPWCYRATHRRLDSGLQRLLLARDLAHNGFGRWPDRTAVPAP